MNALTPIKAGEIIEAVIAKGDIAQLSPQERAKYYVRVCESIGLNPMTRPFEYITLNGKLTLYARKDCTDQLRSIHNVSVTDLIESERDGVFIVTAKVTNGTRTDAAKGAVTIKSLQGEALANAMMKAETKAKRRATLSICGLGFLDEIEVDDIPAAEKTAVRRDDGPPSPTLTRAVPQADADLALAEAGRDNGQQVVWGDGPSEGAAPEDDGIPANLRRYDQEFEKGWLNDLSGAFSGCEDLESFAAEQKKHMAPQKTKVSPEAWTAAQRLAEDAYRRISGA